MSTVVLTATLPTTRKGGGALAPSEIASVTFLRDTGSGGPGPIASVKGPFTDTVAFTDAAPVIGTSSYLFFVTDTNGLQGETSAPATVTVAQPAPPPPPPDQTPSAGTLTAVVQP